MATKEQIKRVILNIAGNPSVGAIYNLADKWAEEIAAIDKTPQKAKDGDDVAQDGTAFERVEKKETRIYKPTETR